MNLIPGKTNKFDTRTLIYESGDNIETIAFIKSGSFTMETESGNVTIEAGNFAAHKDIYHGFYMADYYAEAGCEIIPIIADSASTLANFLTINTALHDALVLPIIKLIIDYKNMYCAFYNHTNEFYKTIIKTNTQYVDLCNSVGVTPFDISLPHDASLYKFEKQSFAKNYAALESLAVAPNKIQSVFNSSPDKFRKIQLLIITELLTLYDDMVFYLRSMIMQFTSNSDHCFFALIADLTKSTNDITAIRNALTRMKVTITAFDSSIKKDTGVDLNLDYNRVEFYFMTLQNSASNITTTNIEENNASTASSGNLFDYSSEDDDDDMYANAFDDDDDNDWGYSPSDDSSDDNSSSNVDSTDDEYDAISSDDEEIAVVTEDLEMPDISNTLKQLLDYANLSEKYQEYNGYMERFRALSNKNAVTDEMRSFRKLISAAFYNLYEEVAVKYTKLGEPNRLVELFLNFGFIDERLLTDSQIEFLCSISTKSKGNPCEVYYMSDWLMKIYKDEELPSKSEFDLEYVDYIRQKRKEEGFAIDEERRLLNDPELKVRFEVKNMFKYNHRLLSGNLLSFVPILHAGNFERQIEDMYLAPATINEQIKEWVKIDYSIFYREIYYANPEKRIDKELIQKELFPVIIMFPVAGDGGIMWQEISGKRSNSHGRIFFPAFFTGRIDELVLNLLGKFRWELCKSLQGTAWNSITVPSLTSEYADYIQFFRKNKELNAEKKEALKHQFTKCHNNMRDIFVYDYVIWMKYESAGSIRLNKVARRILATYCPFCKEMRTKVATHTIFAEAMHKFERERSKHSKDISIRISNLEKKNIEIVPELLITKKYYDEL